MPTTPTATQAPSSGSPQSPAPAPAPAPEQKKTRSPSPEPPRPLKMMKLAAKDKEQKLHPTGTSRGYKGKDKFGVTLQVQDFFDPNEWTVFFVHMDTEGCFYSMDGVSLGLSCEAQVSRMLQECVKEGNTVLHLDEETGMQNDVHTKLLSDVLEEDEDLDEESFVKVVFELVCELGDKFEHVDRCPKTCCQPYDLLLSVRRSM